MALCASISAAEKNERPVARHVISLRGDAAVARLTITPRVPTMSAASARTGGRNDGHIARFSLPRAIDASKAATPKLRWRDAMRLRSARGMACVPPRLRATSKSRCRSRCRYTTGWSANVMMSGMTKMKMHQVATSAPDS